MAKLIYREESYAIIGAAMEVYNEAGNGFVEPVYQESLEIELELRGIPFEPQVHLPITYKGHRLRQRYIADVVCYDKIIVELKAVSKLLDEHRAQVLNYLKATGYRLGLLVNFGQYPRLISERIVL